MKSEGGQKKGVIGKFMKMKSKLKENYLFSFIQFLLTILSNYPVLVPRGWD